MNPIAEDILMHYGMPRRSGRYPWGSGKDPYQRTGDFLARIEELKKSGWTETPENIKKEFGLTTTEYRTQKSIAKNERRALDVERARALAEDGLGATEIGRIMGKRESSIRSLLNENSERKMNQSRVTANALKALIEEKGMIDVSSGAEIELGVSKEKLNSAIKILEAEGYPVYKGGIPQVTNKGKQSNQRVICPPGTEHKEIYNYENVHSITDYVSRDGGATLEKKFNYPSSLDSSRVKVMLADDIGMDGRPAKEKDGLIELRRGVPDLSLGESKYSQVRILVDGKYYLKGMAIYSDDIPDGVDVVFNTSKLKPEDALKKIKNDPENPFGSSIKDADQGGQYWYDPKTGRRRMGVDDDPNVDWQLGKINKRADEGDWTEWKDKLPAQFLSKQTYKLAEQQLNLSIAEKQEEYELLSSLNNPTVKKKLLQDFADDCDSSAVHLKAAALPGQKYHVMIPINSLKDDEVYAPRYEDGTKLALIRYPHGGTFEIPICTVNNKHPQARKILDPDAIDAIGVNSNVAERLSGADYDGDTVMCIPTHDKYGRVKIASTPKLKELENFNNKSYKYDHMEKDADGVEHLYDKNGREFKKMINTGNEMGRISNLISDMTLLGAKDSELARAVKHSMVVIDAEKHGLDYKQSELDNDIQSLRKKYQTRVDENGKVHIGGASTLISRAKSDFQVDKRQGTPRTNLKKNEYKNNYENGDIWYDPTKPEGSLIYKTADDLEYQVTKKNKRTGEETVITKHRHQRSTKMAETTDARTLISEANTPMENLYANYANTMKKLANSARIQISETGKVAYSPEMNKKYSTEVNSLNEKLEKALLNSPRERQAQRLSNVEIKEKLKLDPDMKPGDVKKVSQKALSKYRSEVGAKKQQIIITDKEWEAIQAGAISENKLIKILNNTDKDNLRDRATPRESKGLNEAKINRIKAMQASNYTIAQMAEAMNVSSSTIANVLKGGE